MGLRQGREERILYVSRHEIDSVDLGIVQIFDLRLHHLGPKGAVDVLTVGKDYDEFAVLFRKLLGKIDGCNDAFVEICLDGQLFVTVLEKSPELGDVTGLECFCVQRVPTRLVTGLRVKHNDLNVIDGTDDR